MICDVIKDKNIYIQKLPSSKICVPGIVFWLTCYSFSGQLVHLDGRGQDLDAELVHHQHSPLHLARLLVVSQDIAEDSWKIRVWWSSLITCQDTHYCPQQPSGPSWMSEETKELKLFIFVCLQLWPLTQPDTACDVLYTITITGVWTVQLYTCTPLYTLVSQCMYTCDARMIMYDVLYLCTSYYWNKKLMRLISCLMTFILVLDLLFLLFPFNTDNGQDYGFDI